MVGTGTRLQTRGVTVGDLRPYNRAAILELVRLQGPISRAEVAQATKLSMPAVGEITSELLQYGVIRQFGTGPSSGGRPPGLLELVPESRSSIGLRVGSRTITAVVVDLNASIQLRLEIPSRMAEGPHALTEQVEKILDETVVKIGDGLGKLSGIGVALPAPILSSEGEVFRHPSHPAWGEVPIRQLIEDKYGIPTMLDNVANAAALGEYLFGAGRQFGNMFYVIAHGGIGGAAVLEGDLYRGARGGAGEIGHTLINSEGPRCVCGSYGCLNAYVSRVAIANRAAKALKLGHGSALAKRDADRLKTEDVIQAGLEGDPLAKSVLEETGRYLGLGIASMVNLFDPEVVVIGGSIMKAGNLILDPAVETVRKRALTGIAKEVSVEIGESGEDAGAVGAATLVIRNLFYSFTPLR